MKAKLISLGLCEKYQLDNQTEIMNDFHIKNYFKNTLFHFTIYSEKTKDYFSDNNHFQGYEEQTFKLLPKGGYFNPLDVETHFYEISKNTNDSIIIERQPVFFTLLIPYPMLTFFNSYHNYGSIDWASNPFPFKNKRFKENILRKGNFSEFRLKTDLDGEIKIDNSLRKDDYYNNFFNNNNYPFFIENHSELITIINDLDSFYYNNLGFNIKLENISKIIIPFFELTQSEIFEISKIKSNYLPF